MWPFKRKAGASASRRGLQVGVMYPSGDMTILFDREGVPRVYQRELVMAIAEQVNRHPDLYRPESQATSGSLPDTPCQGSGSS